MVCILKVLSNQLEFQIFKISTHSYIIILINQEIPPSLYQTKITYILKKQEAKKVKKKFSCKELGENRKPQLRALQYRL